MARTDPITQPQIDLIRLLCDRLNEEENEWVSVGSDGRTTRIEELNRGEASKVIDDLKEMAGWE